MKLVTTILTVIILIAVAAYYHSKANTHQTTSNNQAADNTPSTLQVKTAEPTPTETLADLKAKPDYQNPHTDIPYAELFRNSDKYKGQFVHYRGEVIQVLGEPGNWNLRVNITKSTIGNYSSYSDTVLVVSYSQERVIEKDIIEFTAIANGVYTYTSALNTDITVPLLTIYEQTVVGRNDY